MFIASLYNVLKNETLTRTGVSFNSIKFKVAVIRRNVRKNAEKTSGRKKSHSLNAQEPQKRHENVIFKTHSLI